MSTGAAPVTPPQPAPLSQGARVVNTFIAPSKTFADIRRSASWWLPFLLIVAIMAGFFTLAVKKIGPEAIVESQMRMMPKVAAMIDQMPPEQKASTQQSMLNRTKWTPLTTSIFQIVAFLIVAAVLLGTFNFGFAAELKYKQSLAIVAYSNLAATLKFVIAGIVLLMGVNPEGYNIQNPLASNLSVLFDPVQHGFLYGLGMFADVFMIWTLILGGIGFSLVSGKVKRSSAMLVVFGWYVLFALIMTGLMSLAM